MRAPRRAGVAAALLLLPAARVWLVSVEGRSAGRDVDQRPRPTVPATVTPTASSAPSTTIATTTSTAGPPPFTGTVVAIDAADVPSTYHAGCPVGPAQLRMLRMTFWGFDGARTSARWS